MEISDLDLLRNAQDGDRQGFNEILLKYRERLKNMISLRMNAELRSRLDASDVIQDTFAEVARALERYLEDPRLPVFLWLRHLAGEKLIQAHRFHLETKKTGRASRTFARRCPLSAVSIHCHATCWTVDDAIGSSTETREKR